MISDQIIEIGIDNLERLYIKPKKVKFTLIYRTATEVHWDNEESFLYSPKPKDWTYIEWYRHIIHVVDVECSCKLIINKETIFTSIDEELKEAILAHK
jgi:hypothetical protein